MMAARRKFGNRSGNSDLAVGLTMSVAGTLRHFAGLQNWVANRAERTCPNLLPAQLGRE